MSLLVMRAGLAGIDAPRPRNWTEAVAGLLLMAQAGSVFALASERRGTDQSGPERHDLSGGVRRGRPGMGIATAIGGSLGQFAMLPAALALIRSVGWAAALVVLGAVAPLLACSRSLPLLG